MRPAHAGERVWDFSHCAVVVVTRRPSNLLYLHAFVHTLPPIAAAAVYINTNGSAIVSTRALQNAPVHLVFRQHYVSLRSYDLHESYVEYDHSPGDESISIMISNSIDINNELVNHGNNRTSFHNGNVIVTMNNDWRQESLVTIRDNLWFDGVTWERISDIVHSVGSGR